MLSSAASARIRTLRKSSKSAVNLAVVKEGTLLKLSSNKKTWKPKWFVLANGELSYVKSSGDTVWRRGAGQHVQ